MCGDLDLVTDEQEDYYSSRSVIQVLHTNRTFVFISIRLSTIIISRELWPGSKRKHLVLKADSFNMVPLAPKQQRHRDIKRTDCEVIEYLSTFFTSQLDRLDEFKQHTSELIPASPTQAYQQSSLRS